jgi:aspartokinase
MITRIMKFGGTSVANAEAIARVANIIQEQRASDIQLVVVVSAMGGVTDELTRGVHAASAGDARGKLPRILFLRKMRAWTCSRRWMKS